MSRDVATAPVRIGIAGAGKIVASEHVPRFRAIPGVELVAVANQTPESSRRAAETLGIPRVHGNWRDLLDDDEVDAILIGTWPYLHARIAVEALYAGTPRPDRGAHGHRRRRGRRDGGRGARQPGPRRHGRAGVVLALGRSGDRSRARRRKHRPPARGPGHLGRRNRRRSGRVLALAAPVQRQQRDGPRHPVRGHGALAGAGRMGDRRDADRAATQARPGWGAGADRRARPRRGHRRVRGRRHGVDRDVDGDAAPAPVSTFGSSAPMEPSRPTSATRASRSLGPAPRPPRRSRSRPRNATSGAQSATSWRPSGASKPVELTDFDTGVGYMAFVDAVAESNARGKRVMLAVP